MKRFFIMGLGVLVFFGLTGCADKNMKTTAAPEMMIEGKARLDPKGTVGIRGTHFPPQKEVALLFTTADGVQSDIGYALDPAPKAGKNGMWTTTWSYGRFVKKKLVKDGTYRLTAVDEDYNVICETMVAFPPH